MISLTYIPKSYSLLFVLFLFCFVFVLFCFLFYYYYFFHNAFSNEGFDILNMVNKL